MDAALRTEVLKRSLGRCEAWIQVNDGTPSRCTGRATDIHHLVTKARGGTNLDRVGETYHLVHLCRECHSTADGAEAYEGGMLIHGDVTWDRFRERPIYRGPDTYLKRKYHR